MEKLTLVLYDLILPPEIITRVDHRRDISWTKPFRNTRLSRFMPISRVDWQRLHCELVQESDIDVAKAYAAYSLSARL